MTLIDGVNGPAAVAVAMWCGVNRPRSSGVDQRRRLQRTSAPSHSFGWVLKAADMKSVRLGSAQCGFAQPILTLRCAHRSVRDHMRRWPRNASRNCDSSAGFCLAETMGLRSGGSGMGGASAMAHRHIFQ